MNVSDIAKKLGVSRQTIYDWKRQGILEDKLKAPITPIENNIIKKSEDIATKTVVNDAVTKINEMFGDGSAFKMSDLPPVEYVSSGFESLDEVLGGGFGRGRIIEMFGPEGGGKTTLALEFCKEFKKFGKVAYLDVEQTLDAAYLESVGLNTDDIDQSNPLFAEEAIETMRAFVNDGRYSLVVLDSIASLTPKVEQLGTSGDAHMGNMARLMAQAMRLLNGPAAKNKTTLLFLNQIRANIGQMYGPKEVTPGGNAIKFFATHRLRVKADPKSKATDKGRNVDIECVKNKLGEPFKKTTLKLVWGKGFKS